MSQDIGVFGAGVMGTSLALNFASRNYKVSIGNRSTSPQRIQAALVRAENEGLQNNINGYTKSIDFIQSLSKPRKVVMLIAAGKPVDDVINELKTFLDEGDVLIDGGNEWYQNTIRRTEELDKLGLLYIGMGISGGEEGARRGPCLMPGGSRQAYNLIEPIFSKSCAKLVTDNNKDPTASIDPNNLCISYIGPSGSGNYVKMIHNGIEYGIMELIAEIYSVLRRAAGMTNIDISKLLTTWNEGELASYLIEITIDILKKPDDQTLSGLLIDKIADKAGSKGTGKWTIQEAAERNVAAPTIAAALDMRYISTLDQERNLLANTITSPYSIPQVDANQIKEDAKHALYIAIFCVYAQGLGIISKASLDFTWDLQLSEILRTWKGGCIIRGHILSPIQDAYQRNPELFPLLLDEYIAGEINVRHGSLRRIVTLAIASGIPCPALATCITYIDTFRSRLLPTNLIQAQRDYFGAHTYERIDMPGSYHCNWAADDEN